MTAKMDKLCQDRDEAMKVLNALDPMNDGAKVDEYLAKVKDIDKAINAQEAIENLAKTSATETGAKVEAKKASGITTIVNAIKKGVFMDEAGTPLKTGGLNGEDYLLPVDVQLAIIKYKETLRSARDLVSVRQVSTLSGTFNYAKKISDGLIKFSDGDEVDSSKLPQFEQKKWDMEWYGAAIPITDILNGAQEAGLMDYINYWFTVRSIITENKAIFDALKEGYNSGTPMELADEAAIRTALNTKLDPLYVASTNMVIVTNQTGFNYLDQLKEADGSNKDLLQPDPTQPTRKLYKGIPIEVFTDAQLPNVDGTHAPLIMGDTKAGMWYMQYRDLFFDTDSGRGIGFLKNTTYLKVIEGFKPFLADANAYIYGSLTVSE